MLESTPPKKTTMEYEGDGNTNCNWRTRNNLQRLGKETGRIRNQRTSGDHLNYGITENTPGDLLSLRPQ